MTSSAKRLGLLIDELLVFSRMGRTGLQKAEVSVGPLIETVIGEFQTDTRGRRTADHPSADNPTTHPASTQRVISAAPAAIRHARRPRRPRTSRPPLNQPGPRPKSVDRGLRVWIPGVLCSLSSESTAPAEAIGDCCSNRRIALGANGRT